MKLKKYAYLHSKLIGNYTLEIMKNTWKFTKKKPGNIMEFCQSGKVGTLNTVGL